MGGRDGSGEDGWAILEVAREHGIDIPTLCHHGTVEPSGACRLCMVEVRDGRRSRVVASCLYPIGNRGVNQEVTTSYHEPSPECIGCAGLSVCLPHQSHGTIL
jgi:NADH dehydrogenase/NADH:ubiquinone oxidoreductase subunit G